jgi:hypothetical protein
MMNGKTQVDMHSFNIDRFYPEQKEKDFVKTRSFEKLKYVFLTDRWSVPLGLGQKIILIVLFFV